MKIRLTFKDPDGVWFSLTEANLDPNNLPSKVDSVLRRYIEYKEYVTIELDIETGKAEVVPNS